MRDADMTLSALREFRRKLVKAHKNIDAEFAGTCCFATHTLKHEILEGVNFANYTECRNFLWDNGNTRVAWEALFVNSIAALDARIAKMQEGK